MTALKDIQTAAIGRAGEPTLIIEIKVVPTLEDYQLPVSDKHLEGDHWKVKRGAAVTDVLQMIDLDYPILWIVINGKMAGKQSVLHEGDVLRITPVVGPVG
jgi:hypothetical protein